MELYLCEKPLQAEDIANAIGRPIKANGYFQVGPDVVVTWAKGHLMEMFSPQDYNAKYRRWTFTDLPIQPLHWKKKLKDSTKNQYLIVSNLLKDASIIYIATDLDREGESIAREILDHCNVTVPIKRIRITALDKDSIIHALKDVRDESETRNLAEAATARQQADWLVGMNLTRLYSLLAQHMGVKETFHVGRVAIPTIALVCHRDNVIKEHKATPYYSLKLGCEYRGDSFEAKWVPNEDQSDEENRCVNKYLRDDLAIDIRGNSAQVIKYESKEHRSSAPLPFDLNALQQLASDRWRYTSKEVLKGLQSLYEKHKAITYPRTENRYLPSRFVHLVQDTLNAIGRSSKSGEKIVSGVIKENIITARVFDDEKVDSSHHAIIPTTRTIREESLNKLESRLYHLVCRYYVAQFYPNNITEKTSALLESGNSEFSASGSRTLVIGWKAVLGKNLELIKDAATKDKNTLPPLPTLIYGDTVTISQVIPEDHMTTPPDPFTESSLIAAMKRIGKYIDDENLKKTLDETAGLGTAATRADIIETAIARGYLQRETHRKRIFSTDKGQELISVLPKQISSPGTTALWEMRLELVASGQLEADKFTREIGNWVNKIVSATRTSAGV